MNTLFRFFSHSSIQTRILSLFSSGIVFVVGRSMGFFSWKAVVVGGLLGFLLGGLFWYETRTPLYQGRQQPITATQKVGQCALFFLYAIFIGCVLDWAQKTPSPACSTEFLRRALDGLIGFVAAFTLAQILRLWHYLFHGGALDRFIWRERQTGREGMIGRIGIVRERLAPEGRKSLHTGRGVSYPLPARQAQLPVEAEFVGSHAQHLQDGWGEQPV